MVLSSMTRSEMAAQNKHPASVTACTSLSCLICLTLARPTLSIPVERAVACWNLPPSATLGDKVPGTVCTSSSLSWRRIGGVTDGALLHDQVQPGCERNLELVRGEQGDLVGSFSKLVGIGGGGVVGHGRRGGHLRWGRGRIGSLWETFVNICQHQVPGGGVQVSLQPDPHVLPHPVEGNGLLLRPDLTRPNLVLCTVQNIRLLIAPGRRGLHC